MPFDLDVMDAPWRSQLSEEQLDALERRAPIPEAPAPVACVMHATAQGVSNGVHDTRCRSKGVRPCR